MYIATKETAESWRGNRHAAQQTTLSVEVAHFTHDELNILHWCGFSLGASWTHLVSWQNHTTNTNSCQQAKSERGTHQNLNAARAKWSVHTGSRLFVNHRLLSSLPFCNQTQKSKLLSCRYTLSTWTLPLTVLTVQSRKGIDLAPVTPRSHYIICILLYMKLTSWPSLNKNLSVKQTIIQFPYYTVWASSKCSQVYYTRYRPSASFSPLTHLKNLVVLWQFDSGLMSPCSFEITSVTCRRPQWQPDELLMEWML